VMCTSTFFRHCPRPPAHFLTTKFARYFLEFGSCICALRSGFGTISKDNLSIGPDGLTVDGVRVNREVASLNETQDTDELLGTGVSGSVRKVKHKSTGKVYALKVRLAM